MSIFKNSKSDVRSNAYGQVLFTDYQQLTTARRDELPDLVDGRVVYNVTVDKLQLRAAGAWVDLN